MIDVELYSSSMLPLSDNMSNGRSLNWLFVKSLSEIVRLSMSRSLEKAGDSANTL